MTEKKWFDTREKQVLIISFLITTLVVLFLMDLNSIAPDATNNLFIGKSILEGSYPYDYSHRPPLIPSIVSFSMLVGIGEMGARILIPILFMNGLLLSSYLLAKKFYGKTEGYITLLFMLTFPFFWRWGLSMLTDIPIAVFSTLFMLFFYLGVEKNSKHLPIAGLMILCGLLLKASMIIFLVPAIVYIIARKRYKLLISKNMLKSLAIVIGGFILIFLLFNVFTSAELEVTRKATFFLAEWNITELWKLAMAPMLLFTLLGLVAYRVRKEELYLLLFGVMYLSFFLITGHLRLRYLAPLIPIMGILSARGYNRFKLKPVLIILLVISTAASLYVINLDEKMLWGCEELKTAINELPEGAVYTEYLPNFLKATTGREITENARYIVLSIYQEWARSPSDARIWLFNRPYENGRIPPDYEFHSDYYNKTSSDPTLERIREIRNPDGQIVFIIYEAVA